MTGNEHHALAAEEDAEDLADSLVALAEEGEPIPAERLWAELAEDEIASCAEDLDEWARVSLPVAAQTWPTE